MQQSICLLHKKVKSVTKIDHRYHISRETRLYTTCTMITDWCSSGAAVIALAVKAEITETAAVRVQAGPVVRMKGSSRNCKFWFE